MSLSTIKSQSEQKALAEKIRSQCGFLTKEDIDFLETFQPDLKLLIRWQCSRELVKAKYVNAFIKIGTRQVRDVSFVAGDLNPFLTYYGVPPLE
jgi:hypothetical protein